MNEMNDEISQREGSMALWRIYMGLLLRAFLG
jgi:hypothetical protein